MKKNISINISGIIFHIEEDGYEKLKNYLDNITRYFSSFDESEEIVSDIEGRIAEIFLSKLNEGKQIISSEDVESLVQTMGNIRDFQMVEEDAHEREEADQESSTFTEENTNTKSKRLFRDTKNNLVGGVSAGLAQYFSIDPFWIRLLFIILFLGSYGIVLLIYIIMWIVVPGNNDLKDDKKVKKMFRDPEDKVLGGVASGIAYYFGVDRAIVRLIFVLLIFLGGTGLFAYIILWLITPEANSITEKMQMKGEPVTLSNIESSIKKGLNVEEDSKEEKPLVKILLFPFRLIALVINKAAELLGPLLKFTVDAIRVVFGAILVIVGLSFLVAIVMVGAVWLGLSFSIEPSVATGDAILPVTLLKNSVPWWTSTSAIVFTVIPSLFLMLLGISTIAKKIIFNAKVGWALFALFILSLGVLASTVPAITYQFKEEGEFQEERDVSWEGGTLTLKSLPVKDIGYNITFIKIRPHDELTPKLVISYTSRGSSFDDAVSNAGMLQYGYSVKDSVLLLDETSRFKPGSIFRGQKTGSTLYMPYDVPFILDRSMRKILRETLTRYGFPGRLINQNHTWVFTVEGLECITCPEEDLSETTGRDFDSQTDYSQLGSFSAIDLQYPADVEIVQGDSFMVRIEHEAAIEDNIVVDNIDGVLSIKGSNTRVFDLGKKDSYEKINVFIQMPTLFKGKFGLASNVKIHGFEMDNCELEFSHASRGDINIKAKNLDLVLKLASVVNLKGSGEELEAKLGQASQLDAYDYKTDAATINAGTGSTAKINVVTFLDARASTGSQVIYTGSPRLQTNTSSGGKVSQD